MRDGPSVIAITAIPLLFLLGLSAEFQNCAVWNEIVPCTCKIQFSITTITCERMSSFAEIVTILKNRFSPDDRIMLRITFSDLYDLAERSFSELNMNIENLILNNDNLSELRAYSFLGLSNVNYLSLSDNSISLPKEIFVNMPKVKTLDIGRIKMSSLPEDSFKNMPQLENLMLAGNFLSYVDSKSIPSTVRKLHIGRVMIKDLNGTLRELTELNWLFINGNELTTLDGQLPRHGEKLILIYAANNRIERLPEDIKTYINLESIFFQHNLITRLDGVLSKLRKLVRMQFEHNRLNMLAEDEFTETEKLDSLLLGYNHLSALNSSILPLRKLKLLNLTHNWFKEFSLEEVRGLPNLNDIDLSHNRITKVTGMAPNLVEWETRLTHLKLDHNQISTLNGSLSGLRNLLRLNLSHNMLTKILPDDLIGLDQLRMLDVSHNKLKTLEETSKTFLPALEELIAHHNQLTILDRDFQGLPVLCWADLSNNQIVALGRDLVSKTHCKVHGIHEDTWGTLKIYLQDNPILCDAALPEIIATFEVNHARISGASHCAPLSEQPTTAKPNAYLGYIPEKQLEGLQGNSMYNQLTFKQIPLQPPHIPTYNIPENPNQPDNYDNLKPNNIELQRDSETINGKLLQSPLPYQNQDNLLNSKLTLPLPDPTMLQQQQQTKLHRSTSTEQFEGPPRQVADTRNQPIFTVVDPVAQEQELKQLATKIDELKTRVEELRSQNQRIAIQMQPKALTEGNVTVTENISEEARGP